ncbi:MAG: hypothetical protein AW07_02715 [Candidatus Accumulibacter sp. SK-11]|nr:MAG: hypothetical protein AW07_02715 [Candidatus Accumulibacter sp. SK-11]
MPPEVAAETERSLGRIGQRLDDRTPESAARVAAAFRLPARRPLRCHRRRVFPVRGGIDPVIRQRVDDADQGDPVGDGVVDADDDCRVAVGRVHDVELPARPGGVERRTGHLGNELLQFKLAAGGRQERMANMCVDVEAHIVHPPGAIHFLADDLPKASVMQQAPGNRPLQSLVIDPAAADHDPQDLHQVLGSVHSQPGGVDAAESLARAHCRGPGENASPYNSKPSQPIINRRNQRE